MANFPQSSKCRNLPESSPSRFKPQIGCAKYGKHAKTKNRMLATKQNICILTFERLPLLRDSYEYPITVIICASGPVPVLLPRGPRVPLLVRSIVPRMTINRPGGRSVKSSSHPAARRKAQSAICHIQIAGTRALGNRHVRRFYLCHLAKPFINFVHTTLQAIS